MGNLFHIRTAFTVTNEWKIRYEEKNKSANKREATFVSQALEDGRRAEGKREREIISGAELATNSIVRRRRRERRLASERVRSASVISDNFVDVISRVATDRDGPV